VIRAITRERRGAVLAEFAIAFMPICVIFLTLCQLARLGIAKLYTQHAAAVGIRACAVIISPDPGEDIPVDGPEEDYKRAVETVVKQSDDGLAKNELRYEKAECTHNGVANGGEDTLTVQTSYTCTIPIADKIVCGSGSRKLEVTAEFPHQGADYKIEGK
jgi:hypothetical protein